MSAASTSALADDDPLLSSGLTYMTMRLPRGLLQDLEETIIQQDRQFLTEVGKSMGLSRPEINTMLRRVLGLGAPQTIPVLWAPPEKPSTDDDSEDEDDEEETPPDTFCPWWECRGEGLWRRCPRHRIAPHLPCPIHERAVPCPLTRLGTDPYIQALPKLQPIEHDGRIFWIGPYGEPCYNEDGTLPTDGTIRFPRLPDGSRIPVWVPFFPDTDCDEEETETETDEEEG